MRREGREGMRRILAAALQPSHTSLVSLQIHSPESKLAIHSQPCYGGLRTQINRTRPERLRSAPRGFSPGLPVVHLPQRVATVAPLETILRTPGATRRAGNSWHLVRLTLRWGTGASSVPLTGVWNTAKSQQLLASALLSRFAPCPHTCGMFSRTTAGVWSLSRSGVLTPLQTKRVHLKTHRAAARSSPSSPQHKKPTSGGAFQNKSAVWSLSDVPWNTCVQ